MLSPFFAEPLLWIGAELSLTNDHSLSSAVQRIEKGQIETPVPVIEK